MDRPADEIRAMLTEQEDRQEHFYVIPDYRDMEDGERIVELFGELALLTGGSGILEPLAKRLSSRQEMLPELDIQAEGSAILLAGSCSKATLGRLTISGPTADSAIRWTLWPCLRAGRLWRTRGSL